MADPALRRVRRARKEIARAVEAFDGRRDSAHGHGYLTVGEVEWLRRAVSELRHAEDGMNGTRRTKRSDGTATAR